ncbi:MAG: hypothetical protein R3B70_35465 [Polyangiaceae bacterium]
MRPRVLSLLFASLLLTLLAASCTTPPAPTETGAVVLGIRSKLTPGIGIDAMHVVLKTGGEIVLDEQLEADKGALKFPSEFRIEDLNDGETFEATVEGIVGGTTAVTRLASTEAAAGRDLLLEIELEAACMEAPGSSAPACKAPGTCVKGTCKDSHVAPDKLPDYDPAWSTQTIDTCKPQGADDPIVVVGEGQADYLPTTDGQVAQVEAGPQGGHHIWVAVRVKNLTQAGSITSLTGHFPDLGYDVGPFNVIFTFDPDEGGYCKIYGLRFQLDSVHAIEEMLGKTLELTATITDKDGDVGTGTRTVKLSDTILGG